MKINIPSMRKERNTCSKSELSNQCFWSDALFPRKIEGDYNKEVEYIKNGRNN